MTEHTAAPAAPATETVVVEHADNVTVAAPAAPPASALTPELIALLSQLQASNQASLIAAVAELRKPSEEEQRKLDEARARRVNNARGDAERAAENDRTIRARQASCSHTKGNGMTAFVGQINSDGCYRPFCPLCHYISAPIRAEDWQINGEGLQLHKMKGLTIPMLERMAERSAKPLPLRHVPIGMTPDLSAA